MGQPTTVVKIAFDLAAAGNANFFTLDDTTKGQLDNTGFPLAGDVLVDVTDDVRAVTVKRGKARELDRFSAGAANVTLDNRHRYYDPTVGTAVSPYSGSILPRKQIVIETAGAAVFSGQVEDWNLEYSLGGDSTAIVAAADGFALLAGQTLTEYTNAEQLSGARVDAVLSRPDVAWPTGKRVIDAGDTLLQGDTVATDTNALSYLQQVEQAEFGALFVDKGGAVVFKARSANQTPRDDMAFADDEAADAVPFTDIQIEYGTESLINQVTITRVNGGTAVADNLSSQADYGISALAITDLLVANDTLLTNAADFYVGRYGEPELRVNSVTVELNGLTPAQQALVLNTELWDAVDVRFTPNGIGDAIARAVVIEGIEHSISLASHTVTFNFTQQLAAFILDSSDYGVLDENILGF